LLLVLLFVSSGGFFDFTSSVLENVLAYLLIAIYLYNYVNIFSLNKPVSQQDLSALIKRIHLVALSFGLLLLVRHDLLTLFMIPTAYVLYSKFSLMSLKRWAGICLLAFMPLALWSLFSLIYYGVPLPNTAYAKLSTGISKLLLYKSGWFYILQSVKYDIITVFVIAVVIVASFAKSLAVEKHLRFLCLGILANIFYVVSVGGDFMLGRFFSYSYLVAVVLLLSILKKRESVYLGLALGFYAVFYFHTPLNSPLNYSDTSIRMGVADERGFYFKSSSLYRYFNISAKDVFPDMRWSYEGRQFKASPDKVVVKGNIGFFGYYAGLNKLIVDKHALSDPLLSKLPVAKGDSWRIGHFRREIPAGYLDSVKYGENLIADPNLHRYYDVIRVLTRQKKIITYNRLKTILLFNIGYYDHLIKPTSLAEGD
jgi:arabinofuranosyltransferase